MKNTAKYVLQKILGFQRYLYVFAMFKINSLKNDPKEKDFFKFLSMLKDGEGDVLDVGANIGIMTFHLSKSLPKSKVIAVEPMPQNYAVLEKVVSKQELSNVELKQLAVGEKVGKVTMIMPDNKGVKMQGLSHVKHDAIEEWNEGEEFEVEMIQIDDLSGDRKVQGIKMDVENFEYFALKGAQETIKKSQPIIYTELWDNENRKKCFALMNELGYRVFVVVLNELVAYDPTVHTHQNFIFKPVNG
jgi:FkbM family methyltransferase